VFYYANLSGSVRRKLIYIHVSHMETRKVYNPPRYDFYAQQSSLVRTTTLAYIHRAYIEPSKV